MSSHEIAPAKHIIRKTEYSCTKEAFIAKHVHRIYQVFIFIIHQGAQRAISYKTLCGPRGSVPKHGCLINRLEEENSMQHSKCHQDARVSQPPQSFTSDKTPTPLA